ncbi:DUF2793 domain-containing protein [Chelatococcus sp. CO-6]|uniref:DUF2793 domain-containing protein n=3 Tax=unclassified Chelatococcus TaxID=2638111 RepID=UPI00069F55EE|nr:DUF2793 domain-containing protein [Chelatococcus sp. CO-6]
MGTAVAIAPETTANLKLPYIAAGQAQKHVTHNEALRMLDALVQLAVADRDRSVPPADPAEGARHIVAAGATGAWAGRDHHVAAFMDGGWFTFPPAPGWTAYVAGEGRLCVWTGTQWEGVEGGAATELHDLVGLGIGTQADEVNAFAARLENAVWSAKYAGEGGSGALRMALNKEGPADTVSLIFKTDWSSRAEVGLAGSDNFEIKVSADGSLWTQALRIDPASGAVTLPQTRQECGLRNLLINARGLVNQRGYVSGTATAAASRYTLDRWRVVAAGQALSWTEANGYRTFTAPAGGVEQVIEGVDVVAGTYVLSWTGTASASINGAAVAKGGTVSLAGGANVTVRFSGGTFALPQLERGTVPSAFEVRPFSQELIMCQRYFEKSYNLEVAPGTASQMGRRNQNTFQIAANHRADIPFRVIKRAAPTVTIYNPSTGAAGQVRAQPDADITIGGIYVPGGAGCMIDFVTTATTQAVYWHWAAEAEL